MSEEGSGSSTGSGSTGPSTQQRTAAELGGPKGLALLGLVGLLMSSGMLVSTRDLDSISSRQAVIEADVRALRTSINALVADLDEARREARDADRLMIQVSEKIKALEAKP